MEEHHAFTLPHGYVDARGKVHREGALRLAKAGDEVSVLEDPRVRGNRAYVVILLLARVILRLGDLQGDAVTPQVIEGLYSADLAFLEDLYLRLNGLEGLRQLSCPRCGHKGDAAQFLQGATPRT